MNIQLRVATVCVNAVGESTVWLEAVEPRFAFEDGIVLDEAEALGYANVIGRTATISVSPEMFG